MEIKTTAYFRRMRCRPDREFIRLLWVKMTLQWPECQQRQADGRMRYWRRIPEMQGRYLRVVMLEDGETVHNAFFDRNFKP